jgi:WD40 repeat protein
VYASALPFTPVNTLLYRRFHNIDRDPSIVVLTGPETSWSPLLVALREIMGCRCIKFSPDGTQVMVSGKQGVFVIHDATTSATVDALIRGDISRSCAFSPDGSWACSLHDEGFLRMWDPIMKSPTMKPIPVSKDFTGRFKSTYLAVCPQGILIACGCGSIIHVWKATSGTKIFKSSPRPAQNEITCLTFSPDSKLVVSGSNNGDVSFWNLSSGREVLGRSRNRTARVLSMHAIINTNQVLSIGRDWVIRTWDVISGTCILATPLQAGGGIAGSAAFSADGQQIVISTADGMIGLWGSSSGMQIHVITTNIDIVDEISLSPNGRFVASANMDSVCLWDATIPTTTVNLSRRQWHTPRIVLSYSSDGTLLALGAFEDMLKAPVILLLDGKSGKEKHQLQGHKGKDIECIVFSPDTFRIASSSDDGIRVWDVTLGAHVSAITKDASSIQSLAFSPDGQRIVSGSLSGTICVWEAGSGTTILGPLTGYPLCSKSVESVSFSPDGGRIVSASVDGFVHIWDATSGIIILGPFRGSRNYPMLCPRVAFSIDGTRIFFRSKRSRLREWDAITGTTITTRNAHMFMCSGIDRLVFDESALWITDLSTRLALSYPPVAIAVSVPPTSSQTSIAFSTLTNIYIIHFPPQMLSQQPEILIQEDIIN